jgi:hypothetical protein
LGSLWAILKGKGIEKPLGNAQISATSQWEKRENFLAAIGKNVAVSILFL